MTTTSHKTPKSFPYEFGGPVGAFATTVLLPVVVLLLTHWSDVGQVDWPGLQQNRFWDAVYESSVFCPSCKEHPVLLLKCAVGVLLWFAFQVLLERWLPGEVVEGTPVQGNPNLRLTYRMNGHLAFWVTLLLVQVGYPTFNEHPYVQFGAVPLQVLYTHSAELAFVTCLLCFGWSGYLYWSSFQKDAKGNAKILAHGGNSGNAVYDFFMGRELNPRWGTFDWKVFCELRPGLIGWMLMNMACLQAQYNHLGYISGSMMLLNVFQGIYVWDALFQERAILTTMDVTTDGFGYMLVFGDLAWVPFTYSIQARYLVQHDPHLSYAALAAILLLHIIGYAIFRGANGQKDAFRKDPNGPSVRHLEFLQTKRGTKLLTSGWWGMARKINYTGDYIMAVTWCLVCGFDSIVPYYYAIYFCILLVHRSIRDDHMCHAKYGDDWLLYKKKVPYRFIPGVV